MEDKVNSEIDRQIFIGNIQIEKGLIGAIEERVFNKQFIGRLETKVGNDGTDIFVLLHNIEEVLRTYLKESFWVRTDESEVLPKVHAGNYVGTVSATVEIMSERNHLRIQAECDEAHPKDAKNMEQALNKVVNKGVTLSDGWGEWPNSSSIYDN